MSQLRRELLVVLLLAGALMAVCAPQVRKEYLLSRHSQPVEAIVVGEGGHASVVYKYVIDGHTYEGSTPRPSSSGGCTDSHRLSVGDTFQVNFDPTNPSVSGTPESREALMSTVPFVLLILAGGGLVVFLRDLARM